MHNFKKIVIASVISGFISLNAAAATDFIVNTIQVNGLQRISKETVLTYVPIKSGQRLQATQTTKIIHNLYGTGFFKDVSLTRKGNALIINVVERPTIGHITVSGNKDIDKDKLNAVLKDVGLVEGRVFDSSVLEKMKNSLKTEYHNRGRYNAQVKTEITNEERNRVTIKIIVSEGRVAQIKQIIFIGNKAFSSRTLSNELSLSTSNWLSWITRSDQFAAEKLDKSLESLTSYYMDRGYLKFKVDSAHASLTPDKNDAYLTIRLTEGPQYKIKGYKFAGKLIATEQQLQNVMAIKAGDLFSRKAVMQSSKALSRVLGDRGYVFANVNAVPEVDEKTKQVFLTFYIDPGQRVYVRRIGFTGNLKTADEVLRREVKQNEGALAEISKIKESKRRIDMLGYMTDTKVKTLPVPNSTDEVDLQYQVTEAPSAEARAGLGYGTDGLIYSLSVNQANFMGSGKSVRVAFDNSPLTRTYSFTYNNPYYTKEGIQRGFSVYSQRFTPGRVNLTSAFTYDTYGASVNYSIPVNGKDDSVQLGLGYQHTSLNLGNAPSIEVTSFVTEKGCSITQSCGFNQLLASTGWIRNTFDRPIFPTRGFNQNINLQVSLPAGGKPLKYYKLNYDARFYHPINHSFTFTAQGGLGYGGSYGGEPRLPFFQNYYAGGIGYGGAVRGYASNSLGPIDSQRNPIGGNFLVYGNIGVVLPSIINEKVRTTAFVDAGNVYNTRIRVPNLAPTANQHAGPIRYSTGIAVDWRMPMLGILNFSVARAMNARPGDQPQFFQFTFGTAF